MEDRHLWNGDNSTLYLLPQNVQLGKRDATLKFENVKTRLAAKSLATKSSHVGTRAALGNISNVATSTGSTSLINAKKVS